MGGLSRLKSKPDQKIIFNASYHDAKLPFFLKVKVTLRNDCSPGPSIVLYASDVRFKSKKIEAD